MNPNHRLKPTDPRFKGLLNVDMLANEIDVICSSQRPVLDFWSLERLLLSPTPKRVRVEGLGLSVFI